MRLEQAIRLHRRLAERQLRVIHAIGRWPRPIRRVSMACLRRAFTAKLGQVRGMMDGGVPPAAIRKYVRSSIVVF